MSAVTDGKGAILETVNLCKDFASGGHRLEVLSNVNFTLERGSSGAIVGPSGSGKTTLLGLCAGLDLPTSGTVLLNGQALEEMTEDQRARIRNQWVGFVFQNFQLLPTLTALENVMVPLELRRETNVEAHAQDILETVGLGARAGHYPIQLSGGEQQRVAIARAFISRPKVLFADEPTGNLDSETSERIADLLFELNHSAGTIITSVP